MSKSVWTYRRDPAIRIAATIVFTVAIAAVGAVMMALTSSPLVKGAAFLWLPASLQLMAGVWLGPWRGAIAGGVGAQAAGVIAYGGWSLSDFIMNLVAGGFANSMLPALMFRWLDARPDVGASPPKLGTSIFMILALVVLVIGLALGAFFFLGAAGPWAYLVPIGALLIVPFLFSTLKLPGRDFGMGIMITVFISFVSAAIGVVGAVVGGQTWAAATIGTGFGWFLGDTASCVLGLYMLAQFTQRAVEGGYAPEVRAAG